MIYRIFARPQLCNWLVLRSSNREWMSEWVFRVIILCSQEPRLPRDTNHIALAEHLLTKWILYPYLLLSISIIFLDDHSFVQFYTRQTWRVQTPRGQSWLNKEQLSCAHRYFGQSFPSFRSLKLGATNKSVGCIPLILSESSALASVLGGIAASWPPDNRMMK